MKRAIFPIVRCGLSPEDNEPTIDQIYKARAAATYSFSFLYSAFTENMSNSPGEYLQTLEEFISGQIHRR